MEAMTRGSQILEECMNTGQEQNKIYLRRSIGILNLLSREIAIECGLPQAKYNLGLMYADGIGVDEDQERAYVLLKEACEGGVIAAKKSMNLVKARLKQYGKEVGEK